MNAKKNIINDWKMKGTISVLYVFLLFVLTFISSIYYFGIQRGFTPNSEDLASIAVVYDDLLYNTGETNGNIWLLLLKPIVNIFGFSYKSLRIGNTVVYALINLFALDVALRDKNDTVKIKLIPLYFLFMVFLHFGNSKYYGIVTEQVHQYPFNNHMIATLFGVICVWLFRQIEIYQKKWIWFILFLTIAVGIFKSDMIFMATVILPVILIFFIRVVKNEKNLCRCIIAGLLGIELLHVLSYYFDGLKKIFVGSAGLYSGEVVYGATNFNGFLGIWNNLAVYLGALSGLFNFDISGKSIQNLLIAQSLIRIVCVSFIVYFVCKESKNVFVKAKESDWSELVTTLGFFILSCIFLVTENGAEQCHVRYLVTLIPFGTIILCNHYDDFAEFIHIDYIKEAHMAFSIFLLCCVLSFSWSEWSSAKELDEWDNAYYKINEIADEEGLHEGLASLWTCNNVTAVGNGKHMVKQAEFDVPHNRLELQGIDYSSNNFYDYLIIGDIHWNNMYTSVEQMTEIYGEPDKIIEINHYTIMIYRDGLDIHFKGDYFVEEK